MQIPSDIWQALIGLIAAVIGWIARGKRNGHDSSPPSKNDSLPK